MAKAMSLTDDLRVVLADKPSKPAARTPKGGWTVRATYNKLRSAIDPGFSPGPEMRYFAKAEKALRDAGIPEHRWQGYVEWLFANIGPMTGGRLYFASMPSLAFLAYIDRYKATLPTLRLDPRKLGTFLRRSGYAGSITAAVDCWRALRSGQTPPGYSEAAISAGRLLVEAQDQIGLVEDVRC